ncbi:MAG: hypothetical protein AB1757_24575 [Acidobacteriota bacterium]
MGKRKKLTNPEMTHLLLLNAGVCCVCKARGVGVNFHHIDHDPSNNDPANIAVLCVEDHDAHHRPKKYTQLKHTELGADKIRAHKEEWEAFVADAKKEHPQSIAVINAYGTLDAIHAVRMIFQKVDGKIVLERHYHLLDGPIEMWIDSILEEMNELAPNLKLTVINEPLSIDYCPCCGNSVSNTLDWNIATKLTASDWNTQSSGAVYINPKQSSLAITIGYKESDIITAHLHRCGKYLHFQTPKFEERVLIRCAPSVRTQATRIVRKFIKEWSPARVFVGTGDPDSPYLIDEFLLPKVWERAT